MLTQIQDERELHPDDTTVAAGCQFLMSRMDAYYSLGLLLTASEEDAESCFVLALETWSSACKSQYPMGQEVAHRSMKRALVDSAIQICDPVFGRAPDDSDLDIWNERSASNQSPWVACVLQLNTFERFVFVLSVLESYSDAECADVLHCDREEIAEARLQAFSSLAAAWRHLHSFDA